MRQICRDMRRRRTSCIVSLGRCGALAMTSSPSLGAYQPGGLALLATTIQDRLYIRAFMSSTLDTSSFRLSHLTAILHGVDRDPSSDHAVGVSSRPTPTFQRAARKAHEHERAFVHDSIRIRRKSRLRVLSCGYLAVLSFSDEHVHIHIRAGVDTSTLGW